MTLARTWLRRPFMIAVVLGLSLLLTLAPVLLLVGALASPLLPGRWRPLRLLAFLLVYLALELVALVVAFALWYLSGFGWQLRSPSYQAMHYWVLRRVLHAVVLAARWLFRLRIRTDGLGWSPLDDGVPGSENAMLVLSRHAGPGDSFLLVETLMNRDHLRRPRIVLKSTLQLDPVVDIYLNRLPSAFVTPGRSGPEAVGGLARGLGTEDALLIFPEGGNFTAGRRRKAIASLRGKGLATEADAAERMQHLLPPRPGGVVAALAAAPHADVVFVAHTGLEHLSTAADLWRGLPMDSDVLMRWDFVAADDVPAGEAAQRQWLFDRWAEMDRWVEENRRRPAAA
ncbi:MAG TPA: 1-acyl-sn-glycerol-3-phosphate acyltransferase [Mycobacteriales bacterium]|nr:1-acyl-sn-glycerol-3-phosphate acyltransferase [Mycobacteriales bacterium]